VSGEFIWRDAGRTVVFRRGGVGQARHLLHEHDFDSFQLLSTRRALDGAGDLAGAAEAVHVVGPGTVPDLAAALLDEVESPRLVALGGGRTIDAAAIPTTMSGAEMTGIHRPPKGAESRAAAMVRPLLVIADPEAMTSQPESQLRASSMNALAHGVDSLYTPLSNPVSEMTALRGAELIAAALDQEPEERNDSALALGSVLCGYAIDSALFGLHHVVCQTLVQICGSPHAETNAAILPRAMAMLVARAPEQMAAAVAAIGTDPEDVEARVLELGGHPAGLGAIGADRDKLDQALDAILARAQLSYMPDQPDRRELEQLIESAW
jgi:alcohol dehydrogenase class IV